MSYVTHAFIIIWCDENAYYISNIIWLFLPIYLPVV